MVRRRSSPEADIRHGIVKFLRMVGFACYDLEQNRPTRQTPGIPDLYVQGKGIRFWIEVKAPGRKQTPAQLDFQRDEGDNGGVYYLWDSVMNAYDWFESFRDDRSA